MSETETTRLYEAMFLVDSNRAGQDWAGITEHIHGIITRHGGEIVNSEKWDERKLTYSVKGHSRATYILVHFNGPPAALQPMFRDLQLSDNVLRVLVLRDEDGITSEIKGLSDEPTDPVRSTRRRRDVSVPDEPSETGSASSDKESGGEEDKGAEETPAAEGPAETAETPAEEGPAETEETPAEEGPAETEETPTAEGPAETAETPAEEGPAETEETPAEEGPVETEETPTGEETTDDEPEALGEEEKAPDAEEADDEEDGAAGERTPE